MTHRNFASPFAILAGAAAAAFSCAASAQLIIQDDFTQGSDPNNWKTFNGACLTAGDGTGSIPKCLGLAYYGTEALVGGNTGTLPDTVGNGALRFTNGAPGGYNQAGSIISNFTFPTGAGLQVTFKTVTYRGDSGGSGKDGADGISFFLMDGGVTPYDTGAFGGSLGYTCSNSNDDATTRADGTVRMYDGLAGGYLGLGIDEFGNFLNQSDNTATGFNFVPGRIGLRGAGNVSFGYLSANYPSLYPSTLTTVAWGSNKRRNGTQSYKSDAAVYDTCRTGYLWDYSKPSSPKQTTTPIADYAAIAGGYKVLSGVTIANESAKKRPDAQPITYNLKITQDGLLSLSYSYNGGAYQPVITKQSITASNGALPTSFRFGFAGSTGGSNNVHEIMCFQATPADLAGTSVGVNEKEATKIQTGTQAYLAYYYPTDWTGRLTASDLLYDSTAKNVVIASKANWDAQCNLTGIPAGQSCPSTLATGVTAAQTADSRVMLTWDGSNGIPFRWSSLNSSMQKTLAAGDATQTADRLNYLRGERKNEINSKAVGLFRARDGVLGDIIDSSPTWAGPPLKNSNYPSVWADLLIKSPSLPENSVKATYGQYSIDAQSRLNVVFAGANDGFVHGFRSGSFDSSNNFVSSTDTPNDGQEVLAYMPNAIFQTIHNATDGTIDYANSQYAHNWYVDATPDVDELFYNKGWHTWLVGGVGPGGAAIYALDVTDPKQFNETNAKSLVIGEWNPSNISCASGSSGSGSGSGCGANLGNTYGVPAIRRLHNGAWGVIFGNGYGSSTGDAGIYVMVIDPSSGSPTFYYLSTGTPKTNNGISYVAPSDIDGDHITDYVYAGDLKGNVWRFDLTSDTASSWAVRSTPVFTVPSGAPITTKVMVSVVKQATSQPRVMVQFGTGRKIPQTTTTSSVYLSGSQSMYGIWDWDMDALNSKTATGKQVASLPTPQSVTLSTLVVQTLTDASAVTRDVTSKLVCYGDLKGCTGASAQFGWTVALPGTNEQLIFNPVVDELNNALDFNTTIPYQSSPNTCAAQIDKGYTLALQQDTGGAVSNYFPNYNDAQAAGSQSNGSGTPFLVSAAGNYFLLTQSLGNGAFKGTPIICPPGAQYCSSMIKTTTASGKRLTWIQRR
jgi:type IV pilus assembly protein PilY1